MFNLLNDGKYNLITFVYGKNKIEINLFLTSYCTNSLLPFPEIIINKWESEYTLKFKKVFKLKFIKLKYKDIHYK